MVNLVTISGTRHLVDVGFGSHGATRPVPLQHGIEFPILDTFRGKLEYRALDMHTDRDQRLWVFSSREDESDPWRENYAFAELEFFPADFAVMNLHTSTAPQSFFVQTVVAEKTMETGGEEDEVPVGVIILFRDYVKIREGGKWTVVARLETEAQRIGALRKFFNITMSLREERAIRGLASELKEKKV
jgi:arylamine N-acetyltransferase